MNKEAYRFPKAIKRGKTGFVSHHIVSIARCRKEGVHPYLASSGANLKDVERVEHEQHHPADDEGLLKWFLAIMTRLF